MGKIEHNDHYDIVIVGGGAVGLSLLHSLSNLPRQPFFKILVLESRKSANLAQDRFIVLSDSSRKFYQNLGYWQAIYCHCTPIESIQVSVQGQYGTSLLTANDMADTALGYVISLNQLETILAKNEAVSIGSRLVDCTYQEDIWQITYTQDEQIKRITTQWLIGADGQDSLVRVKNNIGLIKKAYGHQAIIGTVNTCGHANQAFERILAKGAIAFLPLPDKRAVFIWTLPDGQAREWFEKTDDELLNLLQKEFGYRLGILSDLQSKKIFPLHMMQAQYQGKANEKLLLMGTAALSLHPIGAQGLNLSLRNIHSLIALIQAQLYNQSVSIQTVIQQYLELVQTDQFQTGWITDKLASYVAGGPFPKPVRALGLILFDSIPPLRRVFTRMNMGLGVL